MAATTIGIFDGLQGEAVLGRIGSGNWDAFPVERLPEIHRAAERWARLLTGVDKPWLCWCVSDRWCVLQQRLVQSVGWTPVVGHDTNIAQPTVLPGSVYVNFNEQLRLPRLLNYFVLEWIFLFAERLAFWHTDFLLSKSDMTRAATCFANLRPGQLALPWNRSNRIMRAVAPFRRISNYNRLWEVVGCNTRAASYQQYQEGLGFWRHTERHPNSPLSAAFPHWEHSVGVSLWARKHPGQHEPLRVDIKAGHANSSQSGLGYTTPKQQLLEEHESIRDYAERLGILDLLQQWR